MINDPKIDNVELLLGCLNCTVQLSALKGFKCNPILRELGESIRTELKAIGSDISHLNMTLVPEVDVNGVATLMGSKLPQFELGPELDEPVERGRLNLNIRAQAKPDHLHAAVTRAMNHTWGVFPNLFARLAEMQHYQPPSVPAPSSVAVSRELS
ncbi:MAG TPA: hypothetical protein VI282_03785 [Verrucomicrobiae bacterium]|jgi:hypothetical protein